MGSQGEKEVEGLEMKIVFLSFFVECSLGLGELQLGNVGVRETGKRKGKRRQEPGEGGVILYLCCFLWISQVRWRDKEGIREL